MKTKQEIQEAFTKACKDAADFFNSLSETDFSDKPGGKWSAGENFEHLFVSTYPVAKALGYPKLTLLAFGKRKGGSKTYEELVDFYHSKLNEGAKASPKFSPDEKEPATKDMLNSKWNKSTDTMVKNLEKWSEEDLDKYQIPHPILGNLTVREMLYFTVYHIGHHHKIVKERFTAA